MEINQFQGITLYAFFEAIAQQTTPLPEDLQQQMSAVAEIFSANTDSAIDQLDAIAKHPRLNPIYEATRQQLQDYKPEELNPYLQIPEVINLPKEILENTQSALQSPDRPTPPEPSQDSSKWWQFFLPANLKK